MQAKKHLGQNFLKSKEALRMMINTSELKETDTVLEIGPGHGALTQVLLSSGATVIAVEKDTDLIPMLQITFSEAIRNKKLKIITGDILKLNLSDLELKNKNYKLIANIPYYITGEIIRKFLEIENPPEIITILVQKEVAERIVAKDKKESILSTSVKIFGEPKYVKTVSKKYFSPIPRVDSAIIKITPKENLLQKNKILPKDFFDFLKKSFSGKRKTITNGLKHYFEDKEKMIETLDRLDISHKSRPENLTVDNWIEIFKSK